MTMFRDLIHFSLFELEHLHFFTFFRENLNKIRWSGKVKAIMKRKVKIPNT